MIDCFECPICLEDKKFIPMTFLCFTCLKTVCVNCNRNIKNNLKNGKLCPICRSKRITNSRQLYYIINSTDFNQKIQNCASDYDFFIYDKIALFVINSNRNLALSCLYYSANKNYPYSQLKLGYLLLKSKYKEAIEWLSLAACYNIASACFQMGNFYFNNYRYKEAEKCYLKASNKNHIKSFEMLYILYDLIKDKDNKKIYQDKLIDLKKLPSKLRVFMIKKRIIKPSMIESFKVEN